MKTKIIIATLLLLSIVSCNKDNNPSNTEPVQEVKVTVRETIDVTSVSANCPVEIEINTGSFEGKLGVCWDTVSNPTNNQCKYAKQTVWLWENGSVNERSVILSSLHPDTKYFVKGVAMNDTGLLFYSKNEVSFTTSHPINTTEVTDITSTSAKGSSEFEPWYSTGNFYIGFCWDTIPLPTIEGIHTESLYIFVSANAGDEYTGVKKPINSEITNLSPNTRYYVRAYAKELSNNEIYYGDELEFVTDH